jgi:hypothetical protein
MLRRRKKRERAAAAAQAQLVSVKERIAPAVHQAAHEARGRGSQVAERVGPVAATAKGKAAHTARERVVPAAITAKDVAIEKATPVVETARDKVVADLLPRLAEAAVAAAGAAAAARDSAVESAQEKAAEAAKNLPANRRKRRRRRFALLATVTAAGAAAAAAWRARETQRQDPWTPAPITDDTRVDVVSPTAATSGDSLGAVVTDEPALTEEPVADELGTPLDESGKNTEEHVNTGSRSQD